MITAERTGGTIKAATWSFMGLSTDDKPVNTWNGTKILNSSTFFEMDTLKVSFYNGTTDTWISKED